MRRRLRHTLFWILALAAGGFLATHWIKDLGAGEGGREVPETARARPVVVLDSERWTSFRIPSNAMRVKLLSRANLTGELPDLIDREFPYELDYELESLTGASVARGTFALRANVIPMVDAEGAPHAVAMIREVDLTPASAKVSTLELGSGEILILKLRTRALDAAIADVSVRGFLRRKTSERKLAYQWSRLSPAGRDRLTQPRLHGLADLTRAEQLGVLQNRWVPFGAQGVADSDYRERILYLRDDLFPAKRQLIEPLGIGELRCGPHRRAIIGVPPPGGIVRLEFRRIIPAPAAPVQIRFFGETIHERTTQQYSLDTDLSDFSAPFASGMLEIESPVEVAVRPFWIAEGQPEVLLEPEPSVVRSWRAGGEETVTFLLGGDRGRRDFFRFSVRPAADLAASLRLEFLDAAGAVVQADTREVAPISSLYDVLLTEEGETVVNDPVELILQLPSGVAAIRLRADREVFLSGYTRPSSLPHRTRVPADYVRALPDPDRLPVWFGMRPEGADDLIRAHRSVVIHTQTRPPEDDADILAGNYQWEDFQPVESALGQYLMNDRDPKSPSRTEALPSLFMPLAIGVNQPLALANPPGLDLPSRRLAFVRDGRAPVRLRIFLDGARFFERDLVTERGELLLPLIPPGSRTLRIECAASGLQCFLNYVAPERATKLKRLAQRVSAGTSLVFPCEKASEEDELLTGMYFAPAGVQDEAEIHLTIRPGEGGAFRPVAESFTLRERTYFVTPDPALQTPVLGGRIPTVDGGRRFFIPLGRDLQPGSYEVTITLVKGSDGYLTLSKVTGGDYSDARFFREASR